MPLRITRGIDAQDRQIQAQRRLIAEPSVRRMYSPSRAEEAILGMMA